MPFPDKISVFILEREKETCEQLHSILHGYNYEVRSFNTFADMADNVVVGFIPDVFVIDYHLNEDMTGVDVIKTLKLQDSYALIIGIADIPDRKIMKDIISAGCQNFALKTEYRRIADIIKRMMFTRKHQSRTARTLTVK